MPLHPLVVHLPLVLAVFMPLLGIIAWLALGRANPALPFLRLFVAGQLLLSAASFIALETGEEEEDAVERFVPHDALEEHEERAEGFLWGSHLVSVASLVALLIRRPKMRRILAGVATLGTLVVLVLAIRTGHAGAELVYRHGAARAYVESP